MRAAFGEFVVDGDTRQLLRDGNPVHLTPKAYQLLLLLVDTWPRALSKEELQEGLWPSTYVEESNLSVVVAELRASLGDDARQPRYVRTVHGFGYAFAADVRREGSGQRVAVEKERGAWWLCSSAVQVKLHDGENIVGRELPVDVWLDSGSVSRRHACLRLDGRALTLQDLASKNGTWRNGERVTDSVDLADGDELRFGSVQMQLRWAVAAASTEAMSPI